MPTVTGAKGMISVIVPVYDVEQYLRQCLDSIVNQTYRELEILLIDDGSPDNCGVICDEYAQKDDRIRVFHTENRGLSAARNLGLENATGEYIGFVDSDDWIELDMYKALLREATSKKADIVVCGIWYEQKGKKRKSKWESASFCGPKASLQALIDCKINNTVWNKLYRHELMRSILFPEGHNYEDICAMHRILANSRETVIYTEPKYHCRIRKNSITRTNNADNLIDYADAYLSRYSFFKEQEAELFYAQNGINRNNILRGCARGISKVWSWWHGCSKEERQKYDIKIKELKQFAKVNLSPFMVGNIPWDTRFAIIFIRHSNKTSFASIYYLNQIYRKVFRRK